MVIVKNLKNCNNCDRNNYRAVVLLLLFLTHCVFVRQGRLHRTSSFHCHRLSTPYSFADPSPPRCSSSNPVDEHRQRFNYLSRDAYRRSIVKYSRIHVGISINFVFYNTILNIFYSLKIKISPVGFSKSAKFKIFRYLSNTPRTYIFYRKRVQL